MRVDSNAGDISEFVGKIGDSTTGKLRIHENIAYRAVCIITIPYHYVKMVAEVVAGFFLGIAALLFGCQSTMFNKLAIGMLRRSGDSFSKIGLQVCGVFAPNWALGKVAETNAKAFTNPATWLV